MDIRLKVGGRSTSVWSLTERDLRRVAPGEFRRALLAAKSVAAMEGRAQGGAGEAAAAELCRFLEGLRARQASLRTTDRVLAVVQRWMRGGGARDGGGPPRVADLREAVLEAVQASLKPALESEGPVGIDPAAPAEAPSPPGTEDPGPPSPELASAVAALEAGRGETVADLLRRPEMLSPQGFADRAGISRQRLNQWRGEGRVLAIEGAKRGFRYPAWQIGGDGKILPGLSDVLAAFAGPLAAYRFLTTPLELLGGEAPLALLRRREDARAVALARAAACGDHL